MTHYLRRIVSRDYALCSIEYLVGQLLCRNAELACCVTAYLDQDHVSALTNTLSVLRMCVTSTLLFPHTQIATQYAVATTCVLAFSHCTANLPSQGSSHLHTLAVCRPAPDFCPSVQVTTYLQRQCTAWDTDRSASDGSASMLFAHLKGFDRDASRLRQPSTMFAVHWLVLVCRNKLSPITWAMASLIRVSTSASSTRSSSQSVCSPGAAILSETRIPCGRYLKVTRRRSSSQAK